VLTTGATNGLLGECEATTKTPSATGTSRQSLRRYCWSREGRSLPPLTSGKAGPRLENLSFERRVAAGIGAALRFGLALIAAFASALP